MLPLTSNSLKAAAASGNNTHLPDRTQVYEAAAMAPS
jgi:hypothetical protein